MARTLSRTVIAGGVVYPAGTAADDIEPDHRAKITNPDHWAGAAPEADDESGGYASQAVADLEAEVENRGIEVTGTGKGGNVLKQDLIAALEADDAR